MADLDLEAVIKSRAETDGYEVAEKAIEKLVNKTNQAAPETDRLAKSTKQLGIDANFTGARVGTLANEVLRWTGMGAQGTAVSTGLAAGFQAAGSAAKILGASIGALTIAIAFLLPKIVEWFGRGKKLKDLIDETNESLLTQREQLNRYIELVPNASEAIREWAEALNALALIKQQKEIDELTKTIAKEEEQVRKQSKAHELLRRQLSAGHPERYAESEKKAAKTVEDHTTSLEAKRRKLAELQAVQAQGIILTDSLTESTRRAAEQARLDAEELEQQILDINRRADTEREYYNLQAKLRDDQDADAEADMRAEGKRQDEAAREARQRDTELTLAQIQNARDLASIRHRMAQQEKQDRLDAVANFSTAASVLFSKNRGLAIAASLADTYAGANAAFAQTPGPVWVKAAAAALAVALGLANVQNIRKTELGFDDPVNDLLAAKLGRKFAMDVLSHINAGFGSGMRDLSASRAGGTTNYNRTTNQSFHLGGFFGSNETELIKSLNRKLIKIQRLETRTKVGA